MTQFYGNKAAFERGVKRELREWASSIRNGLCPWKCPHSSCRGRRRKVANIEALANQIGKRS